MNNGLEEINCKLVEAEDQITHLEEKVAQNIGQSIKKKKYFFKNEDSLRDIWSNMKLNDISIIEVS